ncbi:uncharacterized protein BBA_06390 [Beauveria bassiana ARSEF 2860]|uniref:DUF2423 domain-containing protein n=1 Tax=Beauveria bassiana (strain ARSEF 2860) TaxID=655819 RepID=J5JPI8_BEAB2|nr:uncharacterized protein BBA_06390 [Beauveria bassiana ARSEF 2860]EJP64821.1 hypothetical protein BBA_06390 [Beauveria bassiana ARSEF 2860]
MAKSGRSSTRKANNRRLAATVFGPAETARAERLSAKLQELAKQPKPETSDANMEGKSDEITKKPPSSETNSSAPTKDADVEAEAADAGDAVAMDVDKKRAASKRIGRKRIDKRKPKKASIVFPKYSDRVKAKKNKKKA